MVETYYRLGIRYILLFYNTRNAVGDGIIEKIDGGLSKFGFKLVEKMNRVGM
jgi:membrane dipeptidase